MISRSSPALTTLATRGLDLREVPFIPGHKKVRFPRYRAGDELVVVWIG
jgi:hypothetical protein